MVADRPMRYQVMLRKEVRKGGGLSKIGGDQGAAACYPLELALVTEPHGDRLNEQSIVRM